MQVLLCSFYSQYYVRLVNIPQNVELSGEISITLFHKGRKRFRKEGMFIVILLQD